MSAGERCDDGNTNDKDRCDSRCQEHCGDGKLRDTEECDTAGDSPECDADCTFAECGDGSLNRAAGEECDDGNRTDGDGCAGNCLSECGNGRIDGRESCDDRGESVDCNVDCTPASCGDGILNLTAGEECDDGNDQTGDDCDPGCRLEKG